MQRHIYIFVIQTIILFENFIYSKALIGHNITHVGENEFPSVACIAIYNPQQSLNHNLVCTGTLISERHVLTAEHCFEDINEQVLEVLIGPGEFSRSSPYFVVWWISYHQWSATIQSSNNTLYFDMAVLKLQGRLPRINSALVLSISTTYFFGLHVDLLGCGITNTGSISTSIQKGKAKVLSNSDCETKITFLEQIQIPVPPNVFCTQANPYVYVEEGDSGGPVFFFGVFVGIHVGVCPTMNDEFSSMKVNSHMATETALDFINAIMAE